MPSACIQHLPLRYFHSSMIGKLLAPAIICCLGSHANESHTEPGLLIAIRHSYSLFFQRMSILFPALRPEEGLAHPSHCGFLYVPSK